MDLSLLKQKISVSKLLTGEERSYWLANLSLLDAIQIQKLEFILAEAETLPWNKQMNAYVQTH